MPLLDEIDNPSQDRDRAQEDAEIALLKATRELLQIKIKVAKLEKEVAILTEARARLNYLQEVVKQDFPTVYGNYKEAMSEAIGNTQ
jgi:hypothetical protein